MLNNSNKNIYNMELHEVIVSDEYFPNHNLYTTIMRVAGGRIYRSYDKSSNIMGMVFIPFNNEFNEDSNVSDS